MSNTTSNVKARLQKKLAQKSVEKYDDLIQPFKEKITNLSSKLGRTHLKVCTEHYELDLPEKLKTPEALTVIALKYPEITGSAVVLGCFKIVEALINYGPRDYQYHGMLVSSLYYGHEKVFKFLLDTLFANFSEAECVDQLSPPEKTTALLHAMLYGKKNITKMILDKIAKLKSLHRKRILNAQTSQDYSNDQSSNFDSNSVLEVSIRHGEKDLALRLAKDPDVDVNALSAKGITLLTKIFLYMTKENCEHMTSLARNMMLNGAKLDYLSRDSQTILHQAILDNNDVAIEVFLKLLSEHTEKNEAERKRILDIRDKAGCTALMCAAKINNPKLVQRLYELGANIFLTDNDGRTLLIRSVIVANFEIVQYLLGILKASQLSKEKREAFINQQDNQGMSALLFAAEFITKNVNSERYKKLYEMLITAGADVLAQTNKGGTSLMQAIALENLDSARYLIDTCPKQLKEALLHKTDLGGQTALTGAFYLEEDLSSNAVDLLIKSGYDPDFITILPLNILLQNTPFDCESSSNAIVLAAYRGRQKTIKQLMAAGARMEISSRTSINPMYATLEKKDYKTLSFLLENKCDINAYYNSFVRFNILKFVFALFQAGHYSIDDVMIVLSLALKYSINLQPADAMLGYSNLMDACYFGLPETVIESLIKAGAKLDFQNHQGQTALMIAAAAGNVSAVACLLKHGANFKIKEKTGCNALHFAAGCKNETFSSDKNDTSAAEIIKILCMEGADPNVVSKYSIPPITIACEEQNPKALTALLDHGANPWVYAGGDYEVNMTPIEVARCTDNIELIRRLINHETMTKKMLESRLDLSNVCIIDSKEVFTVFIQECLKKYPEILMDLFDLMIKLHSVRNLFQNLENMLKNLEALLEIYFRALLQAHNKTAHASNQRTLTDRQLQGTCQYLKKQIQQLACIEDALVIKLQNTTIILDLEQLLVIASAFRGKQEPNIEKLEQNLLESKTREIKAKQEALDQALMKFRKDINRQDFKAKYEQTEELLNHLFASEPEDSPYIKALIEALQKDAKEVAEKFKAAYQEICRVISIYFKDGLISKGVVLKEEDRATYNLAANKFSNCFSQFQKIQLQIDEERREDQRLKLRRKRQLNQIDTSQVSTNNRQNFRNALLDANASEIDAGEIKEHKENKDRKDEKDVKELKALGEIRSDKAATAIQVRRPVPQSAERRIQDIRQALFHSVQSVDKHAQSAIVGTLGTAFYSKSKSSSTRFFVLHKDLKHIQQEPTNSRPKKVWDFLKAIAEQRFTEKYTLLNRALMFGGLSHLMELLQHYPNNVHFDHEDAQNIRTKLYHVNISQLLDEKTIDISAIFSMFLKKLSGDEIDEDALYEQCANLMYLREIPRVVNCPLHVLKEEWAKLNERLTIFIKQLREISELRGVSVNPMNDPAVLEMMGFLYAHMGSILKKWQIKDKAGMNHIKDAEAIIALGKAYRHNQDGWQGKLKEIMQDQFPVVVLTARAAANTLRSTVTSTVNSTAASTQAALNSTQAALTSTVSSTVSSTAASTQITVTSTQAGSKPSQLSQLSAQAAPFVPMFELQSQGQIQAQAGAQSQAQRSSTGQTSQLQLESKASKKNNKKEKIKNNQVMS